jgi:hypothetical protein
MRDQPVPGDAVASDDTAPQELTMLYQADIVQASEQRRAEFVAAAEQYRLARLGRVTRVAVGTRGAESGWLRGLGRRAVCALVGRFRRRYATT